MPKTEQLNVRLAPAVKAAAESVFRELGLTPTQAVTLFYSQVSLRKGLPFDVRLPNAETQAAMQDVLEGRDLTSYDSLEDLQRTLK